MKKILLLALMVSVCFWSTNAQVGIGTTTPDASSILDIESTTQGILIPRLTTAQINAISNPATSLLVYNTDLNEYEYNCGTPILPDWNKITHNMSVKYSNTDTTTNLNQNTAFNLPIFGSQDWNDNITLYNVNTGSNNVTITESGRYKIMVNVSFIASTTNARMAPEIYITINGSQVGAYASTGYMRRANNHNESSLHLIEVLNINANDVLSISVLRAAQAGTVNLRATGTSNIYIEKIK